MSEKDSFVELINGSPVFSIRPDQDELFYKTESNRLIQHIYLYLTGLYPNSEVDGLAVVETVKECLKYYDPEKGSFLNYFLVSYKKEKIYADSKERLDQRSGGVRFSRSETALSGKICNYLKHHPEVNEDQLILLVEQYASDLAMTPEELKKAVQIYRSSQAEYGDAPAGQEDESGTRFDRIADHQSEFVETLISGEQAKTIIDLLEQVYLSSGKAAREVTSIKLTSAITGDGQEELIDYIRDKAFFHEKTWRYVSESGAILKNRQISQIIHKSEANITQIWKRFEEKVRTCLQAYYGK